MNFEDVKILFKWLFKNTLFEGKLFFVGGCVRDLAMGNSPKDVDLVVNINGGSKLVAEFIHNHFKNETTHPYKKGNYPIYSVSFIKNFHIDNGNKIFKLNGIDVEISETMKEKYENSNSRQRIVEFASLEEDIFRRDFSINSGLIDVVSGEFINICKSFHEDIKNKIIRCNDNVDKDKIFSDDPLRCVRAAVFASRFNLQIEQDTIDSIRKNAYRIKIVAIERIMQEICKVANIHMGFYNLIINLNNLNLLNYIFPEIYKQQFIYQFIFKDGKYIEDVRGIHLEGITVYHHTLSVLRNVKPGLIVGLSALFHDIGKNEEIREELEGKIRFVNHEIVGEKIAENILKKLRFDKKTIDKVCKIVRYHMIFHKISTYSKKGIRKFIREFNDNDLIDELFEISKADCLGTIRKFSDGSIGCNPVHYKEFELIKQIIDEDKIEYRKNKNIFNGNELMEKLGIQGKIVGQAMNIMYDIQDEYGINVDKDFAIKEIKKRLNLTK